jgi:hypothetical protein
MTASKCERFELEIGMRDHGALDAAEEAALDAHLQTCGSCGAFAAASRGVDSALRQQSGSDVANLDWSRLRADVTRTARRDRLKLWLAPIFLLQVPFVALVAPVKLPREVLIAGPFATVAIFVAYVWLVGRPFREVVAVVKDGDDLLRGYLRELRRKLVRSRIFAALNASLALISVACALALSPVRAYAAFCALLFGVWAAYDLAVKGPRLRRALAEAGR